MNLPMASLGLFVFMLRTIPVQQMRRGSQWRYAKNDRVGAAPAYQFLGEGEDSITLACTLYPELTGGKWDITLLRVMAADGTAWPLITGDGRYLGEWIVEDIQETGTEFTGNGQARKIEFSMSLKKVDNMLEDLLGDIGLWL